MTKDFEDPFLKNAFQFCNCLEALAQNKDNHQVMKKILKEALEYRSQLKPNQC